MMAHLLLDLASRQELPMTVFFDDSVEYRAATSLGISRDCRPESANRELRPAASFANETGRAKPRVHQVYRNSRGFEWEVLGEFAVGICFYKLGEGIPGLEEGVRWL
jgi:hypothetical protein